MSETTVIAAPDTVSLAEAARRCGIGRSTAYKLARTGWLTDGLPVLWFGSTPKVPRARLEAVLAGEAS